MGFLTGEKDSSLTCWRKDDTVSIGSCRQIVRRGCLITCKFILSLGVAGTEEALSAVECVWFCISGKRQAFLAKVPKRECTLVPINV